MWIAARKRNQILEPVKSAAESLIMLLLIIAMVAAVWAYQQYRESHDLPQAQTSMTLNQPM